MLKIGNILTALVVVFTVSFLEPQADSLNGNVQTVFTMCAALTLIATTALMSASPDFNGRVGPRRLLRAYVFGVGALIAGGFLMRAFGSDIDMLGIWIYMIAYPLMYVSVGVVALAWIADRVLAKRRQSNS